MTLATGRSVWSLPFSSVMVHHMKCILKTLAGFCTAAALSTSAYASIVIGGTRVVYNEGAREVSVQLDNNGDLPSLVQSWIDAGNLDSSPEDSDAPFVLTPPIARVNAHSGQALRIAFTGSAQPLPTDHETVFWLNVLDIPPEPTAAPSSNKNFIQLAFRSRIKLFYRPKGLSGAANDAPDAIQWRQGKTDKGAPAIVASNPTPYHVSMIAVNAVYGQKSTDLAPQGYMLAPGEQHAFELPKENGTAPATVTYSAINDFGGHIQRTKPITH